MHGPQQHPHRYRIGRTADRRIAKDGTTPHPTTDHWRRWREDNQLMSDLGLQVARVGVEWSRVEPEPGRYDHDALQRYREEFLVAGATGMMTIATGMGLVYAAAMLLGLSWGVFSSVDQAMVNESLPSKKNRARDVSLMSLTQGVSNMFCVCGALLVLPVTSSK